ncbi:N-acetylmuramic acid 6-phosphate etherase [Polycladomyces subterraneus]|uniref:N-acetylmuramic acid 6-phosphate etherase n=1 Tax=Polycladomyces subterraneus TaxID=1016997 RepID=A0ABT8IKA0_9BACL|nr:N-acetylmuramic acid 6-phosphate etherase [Polycladomyces subterraneus]MDN4592589.1 N-acetylmuramic acid 6-phosphate etherase [Polycladomyces subterraneus]
MEPDLSRLITEQINERTRDLDQMSALEIVRVMNEEDRRVPLAVGEVLPQVAQAVEAMVDTLKQGGHIFYIGAGTSGRLGVLDASECPPTFSADPSWFQGIIAGGDTALRHAVEGAEDDPLQAATDLEEHGFCSRDLLVGLATSGRTPYVIGAVKYAKQTGARTVAITCNPGSVLGKLADIPIEVNVGPEVLVGSTRLKSGTAQKMILNMLSTATMVRMGKVYQNLMVDLQPSNQKLEDRARRIIRQITGVTPEEAEAAWLRCDKEVKTAIISLLTDQTPERARQLLRQAEGQVRKALQLAKKHLSDQ